MHEVVSQTMSVAILAIEEAGKMPVLRALATVGDPQHLNETWKNFRSHQVKNVMWLMPLYVMAGVQTLAGFKPLFDPKSKHPHVLDQLKQLSLSHLSLSDPF
jgi:AbiV family abortive infection protein